jgi:TfoX/Sxy family transcriptional regulator of competence genes
MAYSEILVNRIREFLIHEPNVEEKNMFGGVCFMVNEKMCVGVVKSEMMCRIDPATCELLLETQGCRPMDFNGKPMKGYVFVEENVLRDRDDLSFWMNRCLDFNPLAKASKKKTKKN